MRKFPFYGQHDAMQCGISCLQMICKYHGKYYSQENYPLTSCHPNKFVSLIKYPKYLCRNLSGRI